MFLEDLPEFVVERVVSMLPVQHMVLLSKTSKDKHRDITSSSFIRWVASTRQHELHHPADKIGTLEELHVCSAKPLHEIINFEFACLEIDGLAPVAQQKIGTVAELLKRHPTCISALVEGHTQPGAPEPMATILSKQRAEVVASSLVQHYGVAKDRVLVDWHSSRRPLDKICLGSHEAAASRSRRSGARELRA